MKVKLINHHQAQMHKVRANLGDQESPIDEIRRPAGMRKARFHKLIRKLQHHESEIARLLLEGLAQYKQ